MSEFVPINSQEEFDRAIGARLARERETAVKPFADYDEIKSKLAGYEKAISDANNAKSEQEKAIADLTEKVKSYEVDALRLNAAIAAGLPMELKNRISGETEEEIMADAEALAKFFTSKNPAPLASSEPVQIDEKTAALRSLAKNL